MPKKEGEEFTDVVGDGCRPPRLLLREELHDSQKGKPLSQVNSLKIIH